MTATTTSTPTPGKKRTALEAAQLNGNVKGKTYVITGAYSGIGVETTKALLQEGGNVVVGGRNPKLLDEFVVKMKKEYSEEQVDGSIIDLGDLESVKVFAKYVNDKYTVIDVLICNAGIMNAPAGVTKNGFESQMGVNVIGHFLLAKALVDKTKRQVWVSSLGHTLVRDSTMDMRSFLSFLSSARLSKLCSICLLCNLFTALINHRTKALASIWNTPRIFLATT